MTSELKPCPFCGGEAMFSQLNAETFSVQCIGINGSNEPEWCGAETFGRTPAEAIEAWNTRTEHTCHAVTRKHPLGGAFEKDLYCSECGALLWDCCGDPCYSLTLEEQKYCYNCGAKVVE